MVGQGMGVGERRSRILAAREALSGIGSVLYQATGGELAELLSLVDEVGAQVGAARVVLTAEAVARGEVAESGCNTYGWVREHAPSLRQGGAGDVAKLADAVAGKASPWRPEGGGGPVDPASPLGVVWDAVTGGSVSPALAVAVLRELGRLVPLLKDEAVPTVTGALLDLGRAWGAGLMRRLRPRLLAEHGLEGALDDLQDRLAPSARLSSPFIESADLTEYQLVMTAEQAAALEAAIGPLSAPAPNPVTGERDLRPAGQRRVEALTEVCRRSAAADVHERGGGDGAAGSSSAVHVLIGVGDLQAGTGCGEVLGSGATGTLLAPEVVRRLACAADLVPHVLGTAGESLDLGRVVRLFTRAQRRVLLIRDRGCTYPGCGAPAAWCKAHHVVHWADGGASDVDNAALLCQRHHTFVHQHRLTATVRQTPDQDGRYVVWDRTPGSYQTHLARLRAEHAVNDPPTLTPQRLRALLDAITDDDPEQQRWARDELHDTPPDDLWWDDEEPEHPWQPEPYPTPPPHPTRPTAPAPDPRAPDARAPEASRPTRRLGSTGSRPENVGPHLGSARTVSRLWHREAHGR